MRRSRCLTARESVHTFLLISEEFVKRDFSNKTNDLRVPPALQGLLRLSARVSLHREGFPAAGLGLHCSRASGGELGQQELSPEAESIRLLP